MAKQLVAIVRDGPEAFHAKALARGHMAEIGAAALVGEEA
jgi:hypothetical protein